MWASIPNLMTRPLDEPISFARELASKMAGYGCYEWTKTQGYIDAIALMVLREPGRVGAVSLSRHESVGAIAERDLDALRLLAPHIRRAVAISNVLSMQRIKIATFERAFDLLQPGVILADSDCRVIHANRSARAMLETGSPVQSARGELRTQSPQATAGPRRPWRSRPSRRSAPWGSAFRFPKATAIRPISMCCR